MKKRTNAADSELSTTNDYSGSSEGSDSAGKVVQNYKGILSPDDILNQIVSISGLFEKVFGKLLKPLVMNETVSTNVHILESIYGMKDARKVFPDKLIRGEFDRISETVFRIVRPENSVFSNLK